MASYVDMSLDDIIKKKKKKFQTSPKQTKPVPGQGPKHFPGKMRSTLKKPVFNQKPVIGDARNMIISKNRHQITDAREKLAQLAKQKDARLKLEQLRLKKMAMSGLLGRNTAVHNGGIQRQRLALNKDKVFVDLTRQVKSQPRNGRHRLELATSSLRQHHTQTSFSTKKFLETRSVGTRERDRTTRVKPIFRTVENDMLVDEDMDGACAPRPRTNPFSNKATLNFKIVAQNRDAREREPRARETALAVRRRTAPERERSPTRLPSILKKRPIAAMRSDREKRPEREAPPPPPAAEYRIIVSNLRSSVTGDDIQELFGDVGGMSDSRLVRPGTAEVMYSSREDATRAVELYHNRQLDGQPMNCLLVAPRAAAHTAVPTARPSSKPTLPPSSNSNVEPDISTFHKVLFSSF